MSFLYSNFIIGKLAIAATITATLVMSGCVSDTSTGALTSTQIETKQDSHEQRYIAGKCNSANRLQSSIQASEALNGKLTAYSAAEPTLDPAKKEAITAALQSEGTKLQSQDETLNGQCVAYTACEFQASTTKQDCSGPKHKFLDAEKQMVQLTQRINRIKIN